MKLYEIADNYLEFLEAIENGEVPDEAITDTLESITDVFEDKADSIACLLKNLDADIEGIKAEEKRLSERRKSKEAAYQRLKQYLSDTLIRSGITIIETARNRISFRKSQSVCILDEAIFIDWATKNRDDLLSFKPPTINRTAVKKALKDGEEVTGAIIEEKQNLQLK